MLDDTSSAQNQLIAGIQAWQKGDLVQARTLLMQSVRSNPRSEHAWLWLGRCLEDTQQSTDCFRHVLALNPENAEARRELDILLGPNHNMPAGETQITALTVSSPAVAKPAPVPTPIKVLDSPLTKGYAGPQRNEPVRRKPALTWLLAALGFLIGTAICSLPMAYIVFQAMPPASPVALQPSQLAPTLELTISPATIPTQTPTHTPSPTPSPDLTKTPAWVMETITVMPLTMPAPKIISPAEFQALNNAIGLITQGHYADALPLLELRIASDLDDQDGRPYYYRALVYLNLIGNQHIKSEYETYARQALADSDLAIAYGVRGEMEGNPYYLRYWALDKWASILDRSADSDYLDTIKLENLRMAEALGNDFSYPERTISSSLFYMGNCEPGFVQMENWLEEYGGGASPPNPAINMIQAKGYLCRGDLERALEYANKAITIQSNGDRVYLRAVIFYHMGRHQDALADLDGLIEETPNYYGYRYYLRALVHLELGNIEKARADVQIGESNTWSRSASYHYPLARLALADGDQEKAIYHLQMALDSMNWEMRYMKGRMEHELSDLGGQPLSNTAQVVLATTPLPPLPASPTPVATIMAARATRAAGGQPPPTKLNLVTYVYGFGPSTMSGGEHGVKWFRPSQPVEVRSVQRMILVTRPENADELTNYEVFLWSPYTGEWSMYRPGWGEMQIDDPGRFVTPQGEVYMYISIDAGSTIHFEILQLSIDATGTNGDAIYLGPER